MLSISMAGLKLKQAFSQRPQWDFRACTTGRLAIQNLPMEPGIPAHNFEVVSKELVALAASIDGYLTDPEVRFLTLLAAEPTARGEILEIGSFKGKSTIILAKAMALVEQPRLVAVDPMPAPATAAPEAGVDKSTWSDFQANLKRAGVHSAVEFHRMYSAELAATWQRKIRLLWIDGNHTYASAKLDFDKFSPHLTNGGIVALHDLMRGFGGPDRVFLEDILASPQFGAAGICGSIGWAQFFADPQKTVPYRATKAKLATRLRHLIPYASQNRNQRGLNRLKFRYRRALVPHAAPTPEAWARQVVQCSNE